MRQPNDRIWVAAVDGPDQRADVTLIQFDIAGARLAPREGGQKADRSLTVTPAGGSVSP